MSVCARIIHLQRNKQQYSCTNKKGECYGSFNTLMFFISSQLAICRHQLVHWKRKGEEEEKVSKMSSRNGAIAPYVSFLCVACMACNHVSKCYMEIESLKINSNFVMGDYKIKLRNAVENINWMKFNTRSHIDKCMREKLMVCFCMQHRLQNNNKINIRNTMLAWISMIFFYIQLTLPPDQFQSKLFTIYFNSIHWGASSGNVIFFSKQPTIFI